MRHLFSITPPNLDIENQQKMINNVTNDEENEKILLRKIIKYFVIPLLVIFSLPFIVCDLYFAFTDDTCVNQHIDKLYINLYTYLVISGLYNAILLSLTIILLIFIDINIFLKYIFILDIFSYISTIFITAFTIVGGIIFWNKMDNTKCSAPVYNYVLASLIIRFVSMFFNIYITNYKKNK